MRLRAQTIRQGCCHHRAFLRTKTEDVVHRAGRASFRRVSPTSTALVPKLYGQRNCIATAPLHHVLDTARCLQPGGRAERPPVEDKTPAKRHGIKCDAVRNCFSNLIQRVRRTTATLSHKIRADDNGDDEDEDDEDEDDNE